MKKRVISVLALLILCLFTFWGTTVSASGDRLWFIFTSFDPVESVELINTESGVSITLGQDELFDYETFEFVDTNTKTIKIIKNYIDGTVIEQEFNIDGAKTIVGIYDDGSSSESWIELDGMSNY